MTIGIIGAGNIGLAVAKTLARAEIAATIANSRGPASLKEAVGSLGPTIKAGTREEAGSADLVFIAVNWSKLATAVAGLPKWGGRIVIDANNPIEAPLFKPVDLQGRVSSQVVADFVPGARLVKAFNHLRAPVLASDPRADGGRRVLFYSGDDNVAKAEVAALIDRIGFAGIDLGSLAVGGALAQFPGGPLPNQNLIRIADVAGVLPKD
jgi:8-hydroxy-5-deazaflavin:NADPH oxidoreductase